MAVDQIKRRIDKLRIIWPSLKKDYRAVGVLRDSGGDNSAGAASAYDEYVWFFQLLPSTASSTSVIPRLTMLLRKAKAFALAELTHRIFVSTCQQGVVASKVFFVMIADGGASHFLVLDYVHVSANFHTLYSLNVSKHTHVAEVAFG